MMRKFPKLLAVVLAIAIIICPAMCLTSMAETANDYSISYENDVVTVNVTSATGFLVALLRLDVKGFTVDEEGIAVATTPAIEFAANPDFDAEAGTLSLLLAAKDAANIDLVTAATVTIPVTQTATDDYGITLTTIQAADKGSEVEGEFIAESFLAFPNVADAEDGAIDLDAAGDKVVAVAPCAHANTSESVVDATCETDGSVTVTCGDCGATVSTDVIPALGHDAGDYDYNADYHWNVCNNDASHELNKAAHDYTNGDCVCGKEAPVTGPVEDATVGVQLAINLGASINARVIISKQVANYANYELVISRQTVDSSANLTEVKEFVFPKGTTTAQDGKVTVNSDGRGIFYYNQLGMYELGIPMTFMVKCYDENGNYVAYSKTETKSMAELALILYNGTNVKAKNLTIDIARAGSYVQDYMIATTGKGNCTLQTVTSPISLFPADSTYGSKFDVTKLDNTMDISTGSVYFSDPTVNVATGRPAMRFIANGLGSYTRANLSAVVEYNNGKDGSNNGKTYTSDLLNPASNGRYQFVFDNIALFDTNAPVTVKLYNETTEVASITVTLEAYIAAKGTSGATADVFKAIACMGNSARDYMSMTNIWK